jgi:hypothetical protein
MFWKKKPENIPASEEACAQRLFEMATAAKITIAEVVHLVEVGELDGDSIHTPSIYVKRILQGELYERRIERRTVRKAG